MQKMTERAIERAANGIFTRQEAVHWVGSDGPRLEALLKRAVGAGEILRLRRGLFCLAGRYLRRSLHPFELAQIIHGPSYISLESALAHHGWIPEAVYTVTSATMERARTFDTPMGVFSFTRIPQRIFLADVCRQAVEGGGCFFLASPLKALADYVYVHACDWQSMKPVIESLRVEEEALDTLTAADFDRLAGVHTSRRVSRFLEGLRKELKP